MGPEWDQPASLSSTSREPRTLSGLLQCLQRWDTLNVAADEPPTIVKTKHDGAAIYPGTAVQVAGLMAWRAWPMGDRATLELLRVALELAMGCCLSAPWAQVKEAPLAFVVAWTRGQHRESAREWARELDHVAEHAERYADEESWWGHGDGRDVVTACEGAAHDVVASAYACALAFLLEDRASFSTNVYRMFRSAAGIAAHVYAEGRFSAHRADNVVTGYLTNDRVLRRELLAAWPRIVSLEGVDRPWDRPSSLDVGSEQAAIRGGWTAARLRGWIPCLHRGIPAHAFEPYPNELEREDGEQAGSRELPLHQAETYRQRAKRLGFEAVHDHVTKIEEDDQ